MDVEKLEKIVRTNYVVNKKLKLVEVKPSEINKAKQDKKLLQYLKLTNFCAQLIFEF
jgi:hypothetical protein